MLGGVPKADINEKMESLERRNEGMIKAANEVLHDLQNEIYIVTDLRTKGRKPFTLGDMIDHFIVALRSHTPIEEEFANYKIEKIDAAAAEVLFGAKRRPGK